MTNSKHGYWVDKQYFSIPNIENSYWAGFIAADGCIDKIHGLRVVLQEKDINHLKKMRDVICPDKPLYYRTYKNGGHQDQYGLCIYSREIVRDLQENFNIFPRKTFTLSRPSLSNFEHIKSFVVGYIDGDGHMSINSKGEFFFSVVGTLDIVEFIRDVLFSIGTKATVSIHKGKGSYNIYAGGNKIKETISKLKNISIYRMERKWDLV